MKTYLSLSRLALLFGLAFLTNLSYAQYTVDFEGAGETKTAYGSGTVTLSGLQWNMTEVLIGDAAQDWKNGARSARLRGRDGSVMSMIQDKANGIGTVSFQYQRYGLDGSQQPWAVEYSTNGGSSWTQIGSNITATGSLQTFNETVNATGNIRIRIRLTTTPGNTGERRVNVDDITITDFTSGCTAPSTQVSAITFANVTDIAADVNWTNGNGAGRVVIMNTSNSFTAPANGSNPSANTAYSGSGQQVVYNGTGSGPITISGLNPSTTYWFRVYEYCSPDRNYNSTTASNNPNSVTTTSCSNSAFFFRSNGTGDWSNPAIWQTSSDGSTWTSTLCSPDFNANTISIRNGHVVSVTSAITVDQIVIENGGVLRHPNSSAMTLNNGSGDDIVIQNGGTWLFNGGDIPTYQNADVRVRVQTGGRIQITTVVSGISANLAGNGSSNRIIYEHQSIFDYNAGTPFSTANQVYFPDINNTTIPIFRLSSNLANVGSNSETRINGLFEANANISFQSSGEKFFRNGITGTGNISQTSTCGRFRIDGLEAVLGGAGVINLDHERINVDNGTTLTLISNKTINSTNGNPMLSQLRLTDGSFVDFGPYELSGTGNIRFNGDVVISTSHPNGMAGAIGGLASYEYVSPNEQSFDFYRVGAQTSGDAMPPQVAKLSLANGNLLYLNANVDVKTSVNLGTGAVCTIDPEMNLVMLQGSAINGGQMAGNTNYFDGPLSIYAEENQSVNFPVGLAGFGAQGFTIKSTDGAGYVRGYCEENNSAPEYEYAYCDIETTTAPGSQVGDGDAGPDGFIDQFKFDLASAIQWNVTNPGGGINVYDIEFNANGANDFSDDVAVAADNTPIRYTLRNGFPGNPGEVETVSVPGQFEDIGFFVCPNGYGLTGQTGFSVFLNLGSTYGNTSLPIELISFDATPVNQTVALAWVTASELNNDYFSVERSDDGLNWTEVAKVDGAGTTTQRTNYNTVDTRPLAGLSYYRLKQTDLDGKFSYSPIKSVFMNSDDKQLINVVNMLGQTVDQNTKGFVILMFSNGESLKIVNE